MLSISYPVGESDEENPPAGGAASWGDAAQGRAGAEVQVWAVFLEYISNVMATENYK